MGDRLITLDNDSILINEIISLEIKDWLSQSFIISKVLYKYLLDI
jgi:hypothetical protein